MAKTIELCKVHSLII